MLRPGLLLTLCIAALSACTYDIPDDPFSFAQPTRFTTRHLALDLDVDFAARRLTGSATLYMRRLDDHAEFITLDTRALEVLAVSIEIPGRTPEPAEFVMLPSAPHVGTPLRISLPPEFDPAGEFAVRIDYRTRPESTALQWLPPELTAGGEHPYLFSQSQSIHARSWIPLQDTPSVRITYEATIRTPPGLLALMSADNDPLAARDGEYHFEMPQPIPTYLLAIAVGNIHFTPIGERTGVYSEPETLEAAAWEFADTEAMLEAVEKIYGPYQWGRYDLLVLPPSFPFGGMENPRLSFITPTVLAGDRSQVSLIAHELAHSWSGNLVSNATWRDVWLNEGVTSYLDARLIELLYGKQRADEERVLSYRDLVQQLDSVPPALQALAPERGPHDPDEPRGSVPYAKGQLFLQHLEAVYGREVFDRFLAGYFRQFQWQSITTEQFLDYLDWYLLRTHPGRFTREQAEAWLYGPGIPPDATVPRSASLDRAARMSDSWVRGEIPVAALAGNDWSPVAVVHLVNSLPGNLGDAQLAELDAALQLSGSGNALVNRAWFTQVAARHYRAAYPAMQAFLRGSGRIYLIEPVYRALANNGADRELARTIFQNARHRYHPLAIASIERALEPSPDP